MRLKIKESMSSFDIGAMINEIAPIITNRLIDNIYQLNSHILLISFQGFPEKLLLEAGRRLHLTAYRYKMPRNPPAFCRALRKHLRRTRLNTIEQVDFDRIIRLECSSADHRFLLYTEILNRGNHILVDGEEKIQHALTYRRMRERNIVRGETFHLPSARINIFKANCSDVKNLLDMRGNLARALTKLLSIGGLYAEEIILRSSLDRSVVCEDLSEVEIDVIYQAIRSLIDDFEKEQPHIVVNTDGMYLSVLPFSLQIYTDLEKVPFSSFSKAADEYYMYLQTRQRGIASFSHRNEQLEEQKRILARQKAQMTRLEESIIVNQTLGDTIYAHSFKLQAILDSLIKARRRGKSWNKIIRERDTDSDSSIIESINPEEGAVTIKIGDDLFKLDLRKSIHDNASVFYKRAKESKAKIEGLLTATDETMKRIDIILASESQTRETEDKPEKVRKRAWYEKFHWFSSSDGYLVLGGRDAVTNEILLKKYTDSNDVVLHTDIPGSPFGVIKTKGSQPSENVIKEAAQMVASYSKAWRMGVSTIDVYWIKPEQVSKTPPSGEYLPRGSFMIHGSRNYLKKVPLKLAVGIKETPYGYEVIGGPPSAITAQTKI
ncbi:MAG: NFACT family protein, partial [Candidatus Bathyarchaeota archaeon]